MIASKYNNCTSRVERSIFADPSNFWFFIQSKVGTKIPNTLSVPAFHKHLLISLQFTLNLYTVSWSQSRLCKQMDFGWLEDYLRDFSIADDRTLFFVSSLDFTWRSSVWLPDIPFITEKHVKQPFYDVNIRKHLTNLSIFNDYIVSS